jgi:hypothetical protein
MKSLTLFRISMILVGIAAALVISPASKAQSEIAPDHFDGNDSWEAAARHEVARPKSQEQRAALQSNHHKLGSRAATQLIPKPQTVTRAGRRTPAIPRRRNAVAQARSFPN